MSINQLANLPSQARSFSIDKNFSKSATLTPEHDHFHTELLRLAVEEALRNQPPRRRSALARLHYKPEPPVVLPTQKKSLFKGFIRVLASLVRPVSILSVVALVLCGIKASNDWFGEHFWYGVEKTPPYQDRGHAVGDVVLDERLPDGRTIKVRYKGHRPSVSQLPSIASSQLGDMWYTQADGNCWALTTITPTSTVIGWVDP